VLRAHCAQPAQPDNEVGGHTAVRVRELFTMKELSAGVTVMHEGVIAYRPDSPIQE
jgi:hypothetical protein